MANSLKKYPVEYKNSLNYSSALHAEACGQRK